MKHQQFILLPTFETNTYLLWDEESKDAMLIDPAAKGDEIVKFVESQRLNLRYIVNTHGHGDHIGGNSFFKKQYPQAKLCIHKEDAIMLKEAELNLSLYYEQEVNSPEPEVFMEEGVNLFLGSKEVKVIHTPGHTKGGISLFCDNLLFSGDTLFEEEVGRTDLPGGSFLQLVSSIKDKLFRLPEETLVLPGHGESTKIGHEKKANPYID